MSERDLKKTVTLANIPSEQRPEAETIITLAVEADGRSDPRLVELLSQWVSLPAEQKQEIIKLTVSYNKVMRNAKRIYLSALQAKLEARI